MKSSRLYDVIQSTQDQVGSVHLDFVVPDDETCLIQGKVINLYPGLMVNRYTQSTRERLTNMITFITLHCLLSVFLQFPSPTEGWYFSN
jgi:hypothetical protein